MKVVIFESVSKIIIIGVFAYAVAFAYENVWLIDEFDRALAEGQFMPVDLEFNLFPFALCFLLILVYMVMSKKLKPRKKLDLLIKFGEFQDSDERELLITNKATRASHVTLSLAAVIAMLVMFTTTNYTYHHPSFPIYLFAAIIIASSVAYAIAWCLEFNK
ncbi:hypothetical protein [Sporosarcina sp. UB5]|uniref:hypothetical protein n=1 Tax=Sporosarcina sp. UB5 TaxID=3047463 RepID=UPI003D7A2E3C